MIDFYGKANHLKGNKKSLVNIYKKVQDILNPHQDILDYSLIGSILESETPNDIDIVIKAKKLEDIKFILMDLGKLQMSYGMFKGKYSNFQFPLDITVIIGKRKKFVLFGVNRTTYYDQDPTEELGLVSVSYSKKYDPWQNNAVIKSINQTKEEIAC